MGNYTTQLCTSSVSSEQSGQCWHKGHSTKSWKESWSVDKKGSRRGWEASSFNRGRMLAAVFAPCSICTELSSQLGSEALILETRNPLPPLPSKAWPGRQPPTPLQLALLPQGTVLRGEGQWQRSERRREGAHILAFTQHPLVLTRTYPLYAEACFPLAFPRSNHKVQGIITHGLTH